MIEILFERNNINVGKLPMKVRLPMQYVFGKLRKYTFIGNMWDLAYVFSEHICKNAIKLDNFKVEKEITDLKMRYVISAVTVDLEKNFLQQYEDNFLNVTPQKIFVIPFKKFKRVFLKNKANEELLQNIPHNSLGSMFIFFGISWDIKVDWK